MSYLDTKICSLSGVGKVRAEKLMKLGINTIGDLIYFFPRSYEKRGDIKTLSSVGFDEPSSVILTVGSIVKNAKIKNKLTISKFRAFDDSGSVEIVFFNSPYVRDVFTIGASFRFFGKFSYSQNQLQLIAPKYEPYLESRPLADFVPIYPLTEGISSKIIDKLVLSVIDEALSCVKDPLPESIRINEKLATLNFAIKNAHFPSDERSLFAALRRLAFDEMLLFGLGISLQSRYKERGDGIRFSPCSLAPLTDLLPYELTDDQKNAINDIYRDTVLKNNNKKISPMARIIVGDVGSGKTVCATAAMYIAAKSGYQAALMVPTEILARQHYIDIAELFENLGIKAELLLGSTTQKEKRRIYQALSDGTADIVIGTHALISEKVEFASLGLIITDEQHRFGVLQRSILKERSRMAHMLVMSATPIPRTLALAMYGDLDVSRIATMPKGRIRVDTFVINESYRSRLNDFISKQISLGGQCYIVCPAIEAKADDGECTLYTPSSLTAQSSDYSYGDLKNAKDYTNELRTVLPSLIIECLHGKMKAAEKDDIMQRFSEGKIDILVSTTVIEVGINVPNATLMIIENAERFGLSQLHQLRGRVGRGKKKSYCVLVSNTNTEKSEARLDIMKSTYDGYEIAEKDLALRGPGDFFISNSSDNFRQSGGFDFKFAKLCDDSELFNSAFSAAKQIALSDPELNFPEHSLLKASLLNILNSNASAIS